jgi:Fic family protein
MGYLEVKQIKGKRHAYFVKKVSFMRKLLVIKKYIGLESPTINKEKYLIDNLNEISTNELEFRKGFLKLIKEDISHAENLPERVEANAIKINNLIEGKRFQKILDTEFAKEFIFNSNNIEGSKIPPERVREIIDSGDTKYFDRNEVKEVQNSVLAFNYIQKEFKFNLQSIKRLYNLLTKDLFREGNKPYPKGFKKEKNIVGNSETTAPENVAEELQNLINWYKRSKGYLHPLILAFEFHRRYEFIHPFLDGNGRTGRLIMNKILMSAGYPPIIIYKINKLSYFNAIEKSKEGKLKNYYNFMLEQTDKSYDYLLEVINRY